MSRLHLYLTERSYRDVPETPSATITSLPTPVHSSYRNPLSFADVVRMPRRMQQSTDLSPNCLFMSLQTDSNSLQQLPNERNSLDGLGLGLSTANRFFRMDDDEKENANGPEEAENLSFSPISSNEGQRKKGSYADAVRGTLSPPRPASKEAIVASSSPVMVPEAPLLKDSLSSFGGDGLSRGTFGDLGSGYDSDNNECHKKKDNEMLFVHPQTIDEEISRPPTPQPIFDEDPRQVPVVPRDIQAWRRDVILLDPPPITRHRLQSAGASKRPRSVTEDDDNTRPRTRPQLSLGAHSAPGVVQSTPLNKKYLF